LGTTPGKHGGGFDDKLAETLKQMSEEKLQKSLKRKEDRERRKAKKQETE